MTTPAEKKRNFELIELVRQAIRDDNARREQHQIANKFRFIHDKLVALLHRLESELEYEATDTSAHAKPLAADETLVYVYLFNTHGLHLRNWKNMVVPGVFYEYSVNRPIYGEKAHIESLLRSKLNKLQHAYLTVVVKRSDILPPNPEMGVVKDAIGTPTLRLKEGALHSNKVVAFTHNGEDYQLTEEGELVKPAV